MAWISLFPFSELVDGMIRPIRVAGKKLIVVRQGDQVFALVDQCSHENYPLAEGFVQAGKISCSLHGAAFDLASGAALSMPAVESIAVYPVRIEDGMVLIEII